MSENTQPRSHRLNIREYTRKSFPVKAVRVTDANMDEVAIWAHAEIETVTDQNGRERKVLKVEVLNPINERQTTARVGDWVLSSKSGFKVYTHSAFDKHFYLETENPMDTNPRDAAIHVDPYTKAPAPVELTTAEPVFEEPVPVDKPAEEILEGAHELPNGDVVVGGPEEPVEIKDGRVVAVSFVEEPLAHNVFDPQTGESQPNPRYLDRARFDKSNRRIR